jgi:hypothetical protein
MMPPRPLLWRLREEWRHFVRINPSDRPWQMPFAAALAAGLPVLVGALFGRLDYGVLSSLAGMVFLYLPETALQHRMVWLMSCGFGMIGCFALGVISHFVPILLVPFLTFATIAVGMLCRFYRVGPPGPTFFIMSAAVGAYSPTLVLEVPLKVGLFAMGALLASLVALIYSLVILRVRLPKPSPTPSGDFESVVMEPILMGLFVGLSLALAQILQLERPYWVPVSCLAVIQGVSLRAVWTRQLHRILGTVAGLGVTWLMLSLPFDRWMVAAVLTLLTFVVETLVVRHYGIAVVFITPLTIFLAEAAILGQGAPSGAPTDVIMARLLDTLLGCLVGFGGGALLHNAALRRNLRPVLERLWPIGFGA